MSSSESKSSDPSNDQTVAVTGAAGFIGSHLTHLLLTQGFTVRALVHYNSLGSIGHLAEVLTEGTSKSEAWVAEGRLRITRGDILDGRCIRELIRDCDQVFHLAALIGIPYSYRAPESYLRVNVQGTLNVLEAAREECPERVIVTSTSEVYGTAKETPMTEAHPLSAQSPYAASKIAADKFAESYARSFDVPVSTLRPFNAFGPRQSARAVIPTILMQALSEGKATIELGNMDAVRDLTFVEDAAAGFLALARASLDRVRGRVFNMGTGEGRSVHQIVEIAQKTIGVKKPVVSDLERKRPAPSEVEKLIADSSKLRETTGWKPTVTFEEGLARTAQWIKDHPHQYRPEEYGV